MDLAEQRGRVLQLQSRPERKSAVGALSDVVQPSDPAQPNHALQVAQLLGDPEPDIGRPANEGRIGKASVERSQRIETCRSGKEGRLAADEHILMIGEGVERPGTLLRSRGE